MANKLQRKAAAASTRLVRDIQKHKDAIAKHRDALRALVADAEQVAECCDSAVSDLDSAIDTLSQYL